MNTYEKHILQEIKDWQEQRRGYFEEVANNAVVSMFSYTASYVPSTVSGTIVEAVESGMLLLRVCASLTNLISTTEMFQWEPLYN